MRGREFLDIVSHLESVESEASLRTRTGRLYYAAFLEARSYCVLRLDYRLTRSARVHADIPRLLRKLDVDLADNLEFLREFRNVADYDLDISQDTVVMQAQQARRRADSIIARLEHLARTSADS